MTTQNQTAIGAALLSAMAAQGAETRLPQVKDKPGKAAAKREASKADPRMHGRGAKRDKVPAVPGADALKKEAAKEATMVLEHQVTRMQHWVKVAQSCRSQPELLKQYPDYLRDALFKGAKLPVPTPLNPVSKWADEKAVAMAKTLSVEVTQCRRAMNALASQFDKTVATLLGKGTFQQKMAAIPRMSTRGRKADASGQTERKSKAKKEQARDEAMTPMQRATNAIAQMEPADIAKVLQFAAKQLKERGDAAAAALGADIVDALNAYENAPVYREQKVKVA